MSTVYHNRFGIDPSIKAPTDSQWKEVRARVDAMAGDVASEVRSRISTAASDGKISAAEFFAKDSFAVGGLSFGRSDDSIQGAMTGDVNALGLRAGRIDGFDVVALRELLADATLQLDPEVRSYAEQRVAAYDADLKAGHIAAGTYVDRSGAIHELAEGRVEVDYDAFIKRMNPADWSPNLPRYRGGEVRQLEKLEQADGTVEYRQQERMSLDRYPNNLDMTKNSITTVGPEGARVAWHVFHSDPTALSGNQQSVFKDDGYIDFARTADNKVLIRTHSLHQIATPGTKLAAHLLGQRLTGEIAGQFGLATFFKETIERYRAIGEGQQPAVKLDR